jgi:predicted Rossmann fold flavoprotein
MPHYELIVVGGGAAGFFAAITCTEIAPAAKVLILEKSPKVLTKVKVSGGGRCNVTHACYEPRELIKFYPRGAKQLLGPFHHWSPTETIHWFEARNVKLKTESDNRIFPITDDSQTILDCLMHTARKSGVQVQTGSEVLEVGKTQQGQFQLALLGGKILTSSNILIATGGIRNPSGAKMATHFGHTTQPAAPSLFTFKIRDPRIQGLQGISVPHAKVHIDKHLLAEGPLLITHWGLSGPAILKLSAWGARQLQTANYQFEVKVNWCGEISLEQVIGLFQKLRSESPKKSIQQDAQLSLPNRLWKQLAEASGITSEDRWPHLSKDHTKSFISNLTQCTFEVNGKSMNKEEFVTCGGITLKEVNFKTMESRMTPNLYFAGEVLDIDGITGGFNFQAAWTTGRIAGESIAAKSLLE